MIHHIEMKKLIAIIGIASMLSLFGCGPTKNVASEDGENSYGMSVVNAKQWKPDTLTSVKVDSMLVADKLPALNKWNKSAFKDYETNVGYTYYNLFDKTTNIMYTIKVLDTDIYVISKKRVTY